MGMLKRRLLMKIKLGDEVKDKVSGFVGVAVEKREYLNGCIQYAIQPKVDKDGNMTDSWCIDESQIERLKKKVVVKKSNTGGPMRRA
jgi:hypothetical protein